MLLLKTNINDDNFGIMYTYDKLANTIQKTNETISVLSYYTTVAVNRFIVSMKFNPISYYLRVYSIDDLNMIK